MCPYLSNNLSPRQGWQICRPLNRLQQIKRLVFRCNVFLHMPRQNHDFCEADDNFWSHCDGRPIRRLTLACAIPSFQCCCVGMACSGGSLSLAKLRSSNSVARRLRPCVKAAEVCVDFWFTVAEGEPQIGRVQLSGEGCSIMGANDSQRDDNA